MVTGVVISQFSLGSEEDLAADLPLTSFHMESERPPSSEETLPDPAGTEEQEETHEPSDGEEKELSNRWFIIKTHCVTSDDLKYHYTFLCRFWSLTIQLSDYILLKYLYEYVKLCVIPLSWSSMLRWSHQINVLSISTMSCNFHKQHTDVKKPDDFARQGLEMLCFIALCWLTGFMQHSQRTNIYCDLLILLLDLFIVM